MKRQGFTLIELLIVITLLGILAVAVLSAINPIEQINRSRDTSTRSDAEQLINAIDRYYATKGYFPWAASAQSENTTLDWVEISAADQAFGDDAEAMLTNLSAGGTAEIKESYVNRVVSSSASLLSIYNGGDQGQSTYVCFKPRSASFREDAWKRCTEHEDYGTLPSDYPAGACPVENCTGAGDADGATACYNCLP
ncbi:MAG: type II secretion system protein [Candidatus Shapirobacteria bacterium]|nr:type II secretion system protein [Candidatus Shapirobacteria bacterium]MDD5073788.1 type II secretion system protein [Candidatus Shapirobacteria bacterium]MDD5481527.1 type II secretion system protein [Candidatus Shapirobacteria bacterium]